jgi:protein TonB
MDFAHNNNFSAKKAGGIGVTILMHVLVACALIYGLHHNLMPRMTPPPPLTFNVDPLPPPIVEPAKPMPIPQTNFKMTLPALPSPVTDTITENNPIIPATPGANDGPQKDTGSAGKGDVGKAGKAMPVPAFADLEGCKPAYPRSSLMNNESGVVKVQFEIGANSQLVSATVLQSSGFKMLDKAALNGLSLCKFKAAMQDGVPVQSSFVTNYVWTLDE